MDPPTPTQPPTRKPRKPRKPPKSPKSPKSRHSGATLNLAAAVLGWVLPGLGHLVLGQTARGLILAVTIGSLWLGGLLIGGISVIDRQGHPAWFLGQMCVAPSWVVDRYHHDLRQRWQRDAGTRPDLQRGYEPAFGKPEEQGTLYTALAGLLNLLAIIDVLYREPWPDETPDDFADPLAPADSSEGTSGDTSEGTSGGTSGDTSGDTSGGRA